MLNGQFGSPIVEGGMTVGAEWPSTLTYAIITVESMAALSRYDFELQGGSIRTVIGNVAPL